MKTRLPSKFSIGAKNEFLPGKREVECTINEFFSEFFVVGMRRSAAPSVKAAKRARFCSPFLVVNNDNEDASLEPFDPVKHASSPPEASSASRYSALDKDHKSFFSENQLYQTGSEQLKPSSHATCSTKVNKTAPFKCPLWSNSKDSFQFGQCDEKENSSFYFNVVWRKMSKKKHKKWDGDGILITRGRTAILKDLEGKEIAKGIGYKSSELESLQDGSTLCVGGKEIEVMSSLMENEYLSGKCFQQTVAPTVTAKKVIGATIKQSGLRKPLAHNFTKRDQSVETRKVTNPRHDVNSPGALVMPRPSANHQWEHNQEGLDIVDVVVDPHLSRHMRPHQREGVVFLYECVMGLRSFNGNGAILADDMGLGKTLQCISLIWTLHKQGPYGGKPVVKRTLVITPGSLVKNWSCEVKKWLGNERLKVYTVNAEKRVKEFGRSPVYPVMIISYEMFLRSAEEVRDIKFGLVICDEAHRLKNTAIKTATLISGLKTRRRILLTGTPVQNDLLEFHSLTDLCNPGILGTQASFRRVYEEPIVRGQQPDASDEEKRLGQTRAAELNRITSMFFLRRNAEVNSRYLPPKVESVVFCRPSSLQLSLYRQLLSSRVVRSCLTSYSIGGSRHLICIAALKKLCNDPSLIYSHCKEAKQLADDLDVDEEVESLYEGLDRSFPADYNPDCFTADHSGKLQTLDLMLSRIHSTGDRLILVSNYTQTLDLLQSFCETRGYESLRLDGKTPTNKRQSLVDRFNNKHCKVFVFLLSSKAGGVGLNLIGASRLILFDIDWNPANDIQAMARVWRDGQQKTVYVYRLLTTGTIEEKIYQRQTAKQGLSGAVADAKESVKIEFSREELKDLFTLHDNSSCVTHDLLQCTCLTAEHENGERCELESSANEQSASLVPRPCQLGLNSSNDNNKKNLSIAELMEWEHYSCSDIAGADFEDDALREAAVPVSFVFRTKTFGRNTEP